MIKNTMNGQHKMS